MKTLIVVLILLSFLQATLIPLDLVLIFLILRSYIVPEKENLYLGFSFGLFISFLQNSPLGVYSLIFILILQIVQVIKSFPLINPWVIFPILFISLVAYSVLIALFFHQTISFTKILIEIIVALPIYILISFWEERFIVKKEIKLRVNS